MHVFNIGDQLHTVLQADCVLIKHRKDGLYSRIVAKYLFPPSRFPCETKLFTCRFAPPRLVSSNETGGAIDVFIWLGHVMECIAIDNQIGAKQVQQHEQIVVHQLYRRCRQQQHRFRRVAEPVHGAIGIGCRVANMMRLVHDDEIKFWRSDAHESWKLILSKQIAFIKDRIGYNCLIILFRPFALHIQFPNAVPKQFSIQRRKVLSKALHFHFPFSFGNQRSGADDQYRIQISARLELSQYQSRFDGLTDTDTVGD